MKNILRKFAALAAMAVIAAPAWAAEDAGDRAALDALADRIGASAAEIAEWGGTPPRVVSIRIAERNVGALDLSPFSALRRLKCVSSDVASMDVSGCSALESLICRGCGLEALDLTRSRRLMELECTGARLVSVDISSCPDLATLKLDPGVEVRSGISELRARAIWREVCRATGLAELPLTFAHTSAPNAWVDLASRVTVTTGLLRVLSREEELAGILMHEASHVALKHVRRGFNGSLGDGIVATAAGIALDCTAGWIGAGVAARLAIAGHSREIEVEADDLATDIAIESGLDPTGLYNALERVAIITGEYRPSGFNSHPPDVRRLGRIERRIREARPDAALRKLLDLPALPAPRAEEPDVAPAPDGDRERGKRIVELMRGLGILRE